MLQRIIVEVVEADVIGSRHKILATILEPSQQ
jgi:hypothetical protein